MGWERTKALTTELPSPPSLIRWLLAGVLLAIIGALLFILHASGTVKALSAINIWWVSLTPVGGGLLVFCLRCYLWDRKMKEHQFLQKEAEYGQRQWEAWSERYLAVVGNTVLLPDGFTAMSINHPWPQQYDLPRRIDYLPSDTSVIPILLGTVEDKLRSLPTELPLHVSLVTDMPSSVFAENIVEAWTQCLPDLVIPAEICVMDSLDVSIVETRLKHADLRVDLILIMQLNGGALYSDGLAALLLTSDDVAQKYTLPHSSRLLRPMSLDMARFDDELTLFLQIQTVARHTSWVLGDTKNWNDFAPSLMTIGNACGAGWKSDETALLEKWCGVPGPSAPWLLTAFAADLISIRKQSLLTLFSTEQGHFISTMIPGSKDDYTR